MRRVLTDIFPWARVSALLLIMALLRAEGAALSTAMARIAKVRVRPSGAPEEPVTLQFESNAPLTYQTEVLAPNKIRLTLPGAQFVPGALKPDGSLRLNPQTILEIASVVRPSAGRPVRSVQMILQAPNLAQRGVVVAEARRLPVSPLAKRAVVAATRPSSPMNKPAAPSDTPKLSQSQQPPQKINTPIVPPASMPAMLELADKPLDTQSIAGATDPVLAAAAIAEPVAKPRPAGPAIASVETLVASKAPMGSLSPMPRSEVLPVASASLADNPIVVLPPLAQRGQDAPLPVEPVVSVPVESGPRVSYVKALPRYGGGAPPIRFTVASTGETYTLSPVWSTEEALGALSMVGPWEADVRFGQRIAQVLENFHKGEYEASVLGLRELVAERPEEPALQAALGEVYVRQERYGEALPFYQAAARQSPDHHRLRYATLLYLSGDWQAALPLLQDEHRRQPNHPLIAYQIGRIHQQRGEYASARLFLQKAARQSPDSPEIQYQLGITLEMLNERAAAKVAYARAKQLNPEAGYISLALTRLGKTYSR